MENKKYQMTPEEKKRIVVDSAITGGIGGLMSAPATQEALEQAERGSRELDSKTIINAIKNAKGKSNPLALAALGSGTYALVSLPDIKVREKIGVGHGFKGATKSGVAAGSALGGLLGAGAGAAGGASKGPLGALFGAALGGLTGAAAGGTVGGIATIPEGLVESMHKTLAGESKKSKGKKS